MNLSVEKIKALTTEPGDHEPIVVEEFDSFDSPEFCAKFEYLGVVTAKTGNGDEAVFDRLNKARKAFWAQNSSVWRLISVSIKIQVFRACVLSVLFFGVELCTPTFVAQKALERAYHIWPRRIAQFGLRDQREHSLSNTDLSLVHHRSYSWLGAVGACGSYVGLEAPETISALCFTAC